MALTHCGFRIQARIGSKGPQECYDHINLIQTFFQESLAARGIKIGLWVKPTLVFLNDVHPPKLPGTHGIDHGTFNHQ